MKQFVVSAVCCILLFSSCNKDKQTGISGFSDDFESYPNADSIFVNSNWSYHEQTYAENTLSISHDTVHSGSSAVRFFAVAGEGKTVSKSGLASHNKVLFSENDVVKASCWVYIPASQSLDKLLLLDLEDPAAISSGPGIRLMFDPDNALFVERNKMQHSNFTQEQGSKIVFPFDRWVNVVFELKLSTKKRGYVKLWQDNQLLIEETDCVTMPRDRLYITQGTHNSYVNVELGITANSTGHAQLMFVDDFSVWKLN